MNLPSGSKVARPYTMLRRGVKQKTAKTGAPPQF